MKKNKILLLNGSLRKSSINGQILTFLQNNPLKNLEFQQFSDFDKMPQFNPDLEHGPISPFVLAFRSCVREADCVLICSPEYAFGIPGALKNALDWTVGTGEFSEKKVGFITASTLGDKAHQALKWTLGALGANIPVGGSLLISAARTKINVAGEVTDANTEAAIWAVLVTLLKA